MCTTRDAVRNGSTIDKVKDALHLNKNHATATHDQTSYHQYPRYWYTYWLQWYQWYYEFRASQRKDPPLSCSTFSSLFDYSFRKLWSNIANKLDPRVDSDTYDLRNTGVSTGPTGTVACMASFPCPNFFCLEFADDRGHRLIIQAEFRANDLDESIDQALAIVQFLTENLQARTRAASFLILVRSTIPHI
ncbi:hypothetical protein OIDMADRAFT_183923 [Oidiodendron maius Zn]|uniref:Uncharacterized protein n=1 Tax=Oidiodendron maius (strain Zn) TaxID=913774 RepID=A0A0C3GGW9_OIDMZ|nr:hypothetical protein OIDMADRAFT_183923 [Oidiodendron maius Zn]